MQNFMEMLEGKHDHIEEIAEQASYLKTKDGEKKNGTSDVESRWVWLFHEILICYYTRVHVEWFLHENLTTLT